MKSFKWLLTEGRIEWLKANTPEFDTSHDMTAQHRDREAIIDHFATHADPSTKKIYSQWILKQYRDQKVRQEDAPRIRDTIRSFEDYKRDLPHSDINQYDIHSLEDHIDKLSDTAPTLSKNAKEREIKNDGAELIHSAPGITVHEIKTHAAAKLYGAGTKWCTTQTNPSLYNQYSRQGPLYVFQSHHDGNVEKYQLHIPSHQFMDAKDKPADLDALVERHPSLRSIPQFQGQRAALTSEANTPKMIPELLKNDMRGIAGHPAVSADHFENLHKELAAKPLDDWQAIEAKVQLFRNGKFGDEFFQNHILNGPGANDPTRAYLHGSAIYNYAQNPNAPEHHLRSLLDNEMGFKYLQYNPKLPDSIARGLTERLMKTDMVHRYMPYLGREDTPADVIERLVNHPNKNHRIVATIHHWDRLTKPQQFKLVGDTEDSVKESIVRGEYNDNRDLPEETQHVLYHTSGQGVKYALVSNKNVHPSLVNMVMRSGNQATKDHLVSTNASKLSREQVNSYTDTTLNSALALNRHLEPRHYDKFIDSSIASAIANRKNLSKDQVDRLVNHKLYDAQAAVAKRKDLSKDQINILIGRKHKDISKQVAKRKDLDDQQIANIIPYVNSYGHKNLLKNSNLTKDHLIEIGKKSRHAGVKFEVEQRIINRNYKDA